MAQIALLEKRKRVGRAMERGGFLRPKALLRLGKPNGVTVVARMFRQVIIMQLVQVVKGKANGNK